MDSMKAAEELVTGIDFAFDQHMRMEFFLVRHRLWYLPEKSKQEKFNAVLKISKWHTRWKWIIRNGEQRYSS
jgi:hypothetical protein